MKESQKFFVRSSDGVSSYPVEIAITDSVVTVQCGCPAGVKGKLCKHKVHLLNSGSEILTDKLQKETLNLVLLRIQGSQAMIELQNYRETEMAYNAAVSSFEQAKKRFEKVLKKGEE